MESEVLQSVLHELSPLSGARIQRVDLVDAGEVVLELRVPGRTLRLLIATRAGVDRVHLVERRPPRRIDGGGLQGALRRRLEGRLLLAITAEGRTVRLFVPGTCLVAKLGAPTDSLQLETIDPEDTPPLPELGAVVPDQFPISRRLAEQYAVRAERDLEGRLRRRLLAPLDAGLKKTRRLRQKLEQDRKNLEALARARAHGELLKTMLGSVARGATEALARDWETGEDVLIPLDPALDARANLERMFRRAKKADRGLPVVTERIATIEARLEAMIAERQRLEHAPLAELAVTPEARSDTAGRAPGARPAKKSVPQDKWARRFTAASGHEIYVGKGAKENDRLTFSLAKGHDLWLHARGVPGAHVLLRLSKGEAPPQEALLDAAHLAVWYSSAKGEAKAEVIYTEARYVKKTKGAAPGAVGLSKEKTLLLRIEAARLERLLGSG